MSIDEIETTVTQLRALQWLTSQPLDRLPLMVWFAHEDGGLIGQPADLSPDQARATFDAWAAHLRIEPAPRRRCGGLTRLRAQGTVDGILVTVHAEYRPDYGCHSSW